MFRNKKKRISIVLSLLLVLTMVTSMLPVSATAYAADSSYTFKKVTDSTIEDGGIYLIVAEDSGSYYALTNNSGSSAATAVTVNSGSIETSSTACFMKASYDSDASTVVFTNNSQNLYRSSSTVKFSSSSTSWSYDGSKISVVGNSGTYSIVYSSSAFSASTSATNYAVLYKLDAEKYTVSFDLDGKGTAIESQNVYSGFTADEPDDPVATTPASTTASAYEFSGWYTDNTYAKEFDFDTAISKDTTLYAKWTEVKPTSVEDALILSENYALSTDEENYYTSTSSSSTYAYYGYNGVAYTSGTTKVTSDMLWDYTLWDFTDHDDLYAISQNSKYLVGTYGSEDGSSYTYVGRIKLDTTMSVWTYEADDDDNVLKMNDKYIKLDTGSEVFSMRSSGTAVTIQKYEGTVSELKKYTVSFDMGGIGTSIEPQSVREGATATEPDEPSADNYIFDGWYIDNTYATAFDFSTAITKATTVYAKWIEITDSCVVTPTTDIAEGSPKIDVDDVLGITVCNGSSSSTYTYTSTSSDTSVASVIYNSSVSIAKSSSDLVAVKGLKKGISVITITNSQSTPREAKLTVIVGDVTQYTVSFDLDGKGTAIESQSVYESLTASEPDKPSADGFTFDGWYTDKTYSTEFDFSTAITKDTTVYAKWTAVSSDTTYVAFSSDVHNKSDGTSATRIGTWLSNIRSITGANIDNMGLCGDNGDASAGSADNYWTYSQTTIDAVANNANLNNDGFFVCGNYEYDPGSYTHSLNTTTALYSDAGTYEEYDDYILYSMGAAQYDEIYSEIDINNLKTYLSSKSSFEGPIFVLAHFPLHSYGSTTGESSTCHDGKAASGSADLIEVLNEYPNVIFLWGHNHTSSQTCYDCVYTDYINDTAINFTYAAAGCMSDSEYVSGSAAVLGKGLLATITDGQVVLKYYDESGNEVGTGATIKLEDSETVKHTITATSGSNGSISPSGEVKISDGKSRTFTFTPDEGYEVDTVKVDGTAVEITNNKYTITNVTADTTIAVTFKKSAYVKTVELTPTTSSPSEDVSIYEGESIKVTITNGSSSSSYDFSATAADTTVASVDQSSQTIASGGTADYVITGLKKGSTTITFSNGDSSYTRLATVNLTVKQEGVYTVTFDLNGHGTDIEDQTVNTGSKATKPTDPTATGYTFGGWYSDEDLTTAFDFDTAITADTTLYAKWTEKIETFKNVLILSEGYALSSKTTGSYTGTSGSNVYLYKGYTGVAYTSGTTKVTSNMLWNYTVTGDSYVISQNGQYLTGSYADGSGDESSYYKVGYLRLADTQSAWTYTDSNLILDEKYIEYDSSSGVFSMRSSGTDIEFVEYTGDVEPDSYTVTFDMNDHGTAVDSQTVDSGAKATKPADPTADGYIFGGWYSDEGLTTAYDFDTAITADTTLYAKWTVITYTVTFDMNDHGTAVDSQTVDSGAKATKPEDPSDIGWAFDGWYSNEELTTEFDFDTAITANTTVYAKWTQTYTVTFDMNDHGTDIDYQNVRIGEKATKPSDPTASGYAFDGWYSDEALTTEFDFDTVITADTTVYAKWTAIYTVSFDLNDHGTAIDDQTVKYGEKATEPNDPTADGYIFGGWYSDEELTTEFSFDTGITADITLYAKWTVGEEETEDSYLVTYQTHVQTYGWQNWLTDGETAGTSGQSKRLEAIKIELSDDLEGDIIYTTHVQTYGWLTEVKNGKLSGTSGESKRLEAIKISLDGEVAENYDVYYRVHAQHFGWLGWAKNGAEAGTAGYSYRLEAIQIKLVAKGGDAPGSTVKAFVEKGVGSQDGDPDKVCVSYKTHVQTYGWQDYVQNGEMAGTSGQSKRLEGIKIKIENTDLTGSVVYSTHVQTYGWMDSVQDDVMSGTSGQSKRLEAIKIELTDELEENYDIYYRVHAQHFGWLGWAKNGEEAGTAGYSYRLEAIQIVLVEKNEEGPSSTYEGITSSKALAYYDKNA